MISAQTIKDALRCGKSGCACSRSANVHCPNHEDRDPSLTIHEDREGKVLLNCKGGCSQQDVVNALKDRGLWATPTPEPAPRNGRLSVSEQEPTAVYEYRNEVGKLVAIKGRFESGDGKSFKWKLPGSTTWTLGGIKIADIPLWGCELLAGNAGRVFYVEGEKATLACRKAGLLAVTHGGGASTKEFGDSLGALRGRDVVLWPDNDDPGRQYMDRVRTALRPIARSVVTIFPTVPDKGDAFEFFAGGVSADDLLALVPPPPRPVLEYLTVQDDEGCVFTRSGMGYRAEFPVHKVTLTVEHLHRGGGELRGGVLIESEIPAMPRHLSWGTLILSSPANREKLGKMLDHRTTGLGMDWDGIIEVFCRKVALAERQGEPFTTAGDLPSRSSLTDWLITGFAPRLEASTIWGDGGTGKSMFVNALGISVKAGVEVVPGFSPVVRGNVLYLDWEASLQRLDNRIKRICAGAGIAPVQIGYRRCNVPMVDQVEEVLRYCQSEGVVLVIVDSVEMAMNGTGGDGSNPNDKVIALHSALRMLNCTSILIDHINAAGRVAPKLAGKAIGGVYKTNLARMAFELRKSADVPTLGQMKLGLFNIKRNDDGPPLSPIGLRVHFDGDATWYEREAATEVSGANAKDRVCAALTQWGQLPKERLIQVTGITDNNLRVMFHRDNGVTFRLLENGNWTLTNAPKEEEPEGLPF